jgi:hypothetical protein
MLWRISALAIGLVNILNQVEEKDALTFEVATVLKATNSRTAEYSRLENTFHDFLSKATKTNGDLTSISDSLSYSSVYTIGSKMEKRKNKQQHRFIPLRSCLISIGGLQTKEEELTYTIAIQPAYVVYSRRQSTLYHVVISFAPLV